MFRMFHYSKNKGSTLVASIFVLSAISVLAAITLSRGLTSSKSSSSEINYVEMDNIRDTVANKVILQLKKHIWIDGDWVWNSKMNQYVYIEGKWVVPAYGAIWVPGHWKHANKGWYWVNGHWK